jgi:uncharacterized protein
MRHTFQFVTNYFEHKLIYMPRPHCPRKIVQTPPSDYFKPRGVPMQKLEEIELCADEMEALRLADAEGMYHVEAAKLMGISRQTFDRIAKSAHTKVARALCGGMATKIVRPLAGNGVTGAPDSRG